MNEFRIAVIGAGETGLPLLKHLLDSSFVKVVGIADLDLGLPGIALAKSHGIKVTNDFMELARLGKDVDIIIDVTGVPKVRDTLRKHMVDTGNNHTLIMHERIALLMMSLAAGKQVSGKHGSLSYS